MDLVLNVADRCLHPLRIPVTMARGKISLLLVTNLGAVIIVGPQNQVLREIKYAMTSLPIVSIPTVVFFLEASSDNVEESPMGKTTLMISFLLFTDGCIYWIHRFLHHKRIYKVDLVTDTAMAYGLHNFQAHQNICALWMGALPSYTGIAIKLKKKNGLPTIFINDPKHHGMLFA
uniref:Uncharacterized protein n=1 Tax=Salmo trutta TaxID=8032 RepID=A0A673Y1Q7_SALTR